jgi:uncharacterized membrane protein
MTATPAPRRDDLGVREGGSRTGERVLTVLATVAMALMAGTFYAYSVSVMTGLSGTDDRTFVQAMQEINEATPNPAFAPSLLGALVLPVAATVVAVRRRSRARRALAAAAALYAAAFLVTIAGNVPMNDDLEAAGPPDRIADIAQAREDFEGPWVQLNHVRALLSTGGLVALVVALRRGDDADAPTGAR